MNDPPPTPFPPQSLSVVLPTFNEGAWLTETISVLRSALARSGWTNVEIIIVDDGSTDGTASLFVDDDEHPSVQMLTQRNAGRLAARRTGLAAATGELVLFIDSRVHIGPEALSFVRGRLADNPDEVIWNGHAITASNWKPWTRFWDGISFLAWRRYLAAPATTSYGADDFDWYPKGTTMFMAPRVWLIEAADERGSLSDDLSLANDDTVMIRNLLRHGRINISPSFDCTYFPRTSLGGFLRNARHRGAMLVDGHLRPGLRFWRPFHVLLAMAPLAIVAGIARPRFVPAVVVIGSLAVGLGARVAGVPVAESASLAVLVAPFSLAYGVGIAEGFRSRRRTGSADT